MGEGIHLAPGERTRIIHAARKALDAAGFLDVPVIAGAGGGSTRETIALCEEVAAAGADAAIVITPGYFAGVLANHRPALKEFFADVANRSPVPVIVYNCEALVHPPKTIHSLIHARAPTDPGASAGIDLDSDLIVELAATCPNLSGVKLTCVTSSKERAFSPPYSVCVDRCGSVGKLTRIAAAVANPTFDEAHPRKNPSAPFLVLGGLADTITSSAFVHGHGAITGLANIAPVGSWLACSEVD
jgi:4-hydroxy-2-oxoglutarate aldolase